MGEFHYWCSMQYAMLTREKWCEWNSSKGLERRVFECALLPIGVSMLAVPIIEGQSMVHLPSVWNSVPGARVMGGPHLQEHLSRLKLLDLLRVPQLPFRFFMYYEQDVLVWVDIYSHTRTIQAAIASRNSFVGETELVRAMRQLKVCMFRRGCQTGSEESLLPWMNRLEGKIHVGESVVKTRCILMFDGVEDGTSLYYNLTFDFFGMYDDNFPTHEQQIRGGVVTGARGTGKTLATAALISSDAATFVPEVPPLLQHLIALKATLVIIPYYLVAQWKHALNESPTLVLSEANDLCNTTLDRFLSASIVLCTNNYLRQTFAAGSSHGQHFRQVQAGGLDGSSTNLPPDCFYWKRIVYDEPENAVFSDETLMRGCCHLHSEYTWFIQSDAYLQDRHALVPYWRLLLRLSSPEAAFARIGVGTIGAFCESHVYSAADWVATLSISVIRASLRTDAALALEMCAETMPVEGQLRFGCGETRLIPYINWEHVPLSRVGAVANKRFEDMSAVGDGSEAAHVACMQQHFGRTLTTFIESAAGGHPFPLCTICFQMSVDSIILCGHAFCWGCLFRAVVLRLTCPTCRFSVKENNVFRIGIRYEDPWPKAEALVRLLHMEAESSTIGHTLVLVRWFGVLRTLKTELERRGVNSLAMCGNTRQCEHTWRQISEATESRVILLPIDLLGGLTLPNVAHVVFYHAPNITPVSSRVILRRAVQAVRCALTAQEEIRISIIINAYTIEDRLIEGCLSNVAHRTFQQL